MRLPFALDLGRGLFALVLAIVLYFVAVNETNPETTVVTINLEEIQERVLPVRVNVTGQVPQGYTQGEARADPDRVTVAGAASLVGRASEALVDVSIDRVTVSVNGVYTPRIIDD